MTPSPDLLAVLREAREALESVSLALPVTQWARTIDAIGNTLARIDSALSAPEPMGWRPIADCAGRDTAPTTADAGVTEAMVDAAMQRMYSTSAPYTAQWVRTEVREMIEAALSTRKGE